MAAQDPSRGNLALLVAAMLEVRSANLVDAAALPREADRTDMRYQWIARLLCNELIDSDAEMLARAAADRGDIVLILEVLTGLIKGRFARAQAYFCSTFIYC